MDFDKTASVEDLLGDNGLPEGWAQAYLRDGLLTNLQPGFACGTNSRDHGGVAHLRPMNVSREGEVDLANTKFVSRAEANREERWIRTSDVLFNNTNSAELVGKTAYYGETEPRLFSNHMTRLRCNPEMLDSRYCAMALHQKWREGYFASRCNNHVSQASVSSNVLLDTEISLPPVAEQRRIAAKAEQLVATTGLTRARLARVPILLKRFRQAVLAAACSGRLTADWREQNSDVEPAAHLLERILAERRAKWEAGQRSKKGGKSGAGQQSIGLDPLVDIEVVTTVADAVRGGYKEPAAPDLRDAPELPEMPEEWCVVSISQIAQFLQYGTSTKADAEEQHGVAMLRMGNIQEGRIDYTSLKYMSGASAELPTFQLSPGDILFNRTNSPDLVGKAAVYDGAIPAVFASYLVRLRCNSLVSAALVCHWINSSWGKEWAAVVKTDGVSQSNINASKLSVMPFPLPPLQEQQEIIRRVERLFGFADAIEKRTAVAAARADRLTQSILARAFRGELVPTEADLARAEGRDYEPASMLLERVQAKQARTKPDKPKRSGMKNAQREDEQGTLLV